MDIQGLEISLPAGGRLTLRPVTSEDTPFLVELYGNTREEELALTGWGAEMREAFIKMQFEAQQQHYSAEYPGSLHTVILVDGEPVGRLYIADCSDEIRILDITVHPSRRSGGIGTVLIEKLSENAAAAGKPLTIYVEANNPSLRLFERMGFFPASEDGFRYLLKRLPPGSAGVSSPGQSPGPR